MACVRSRTGRPSRPDPFHCHLPMTRVLPRNRLHTSALLHFLTEKGMAGVAADPGDVGQRLGDWLDFRQAIALQGFFGSLDNPSTAPAFAPPARVRVDAAVLHARFAQVRAALEQSILRGSAPAPGMPRIEMPSTALTHPIDARSAFDPFRRYFSAHQRQMETVIRSLRAQLRGMLDKGSARHQRLAALDALFENILLEREARQLGLIVTGFEKRFARALKAHLKQLHEAAACDEPAPPSQDWLAPLCDDMHTALLAELDLRLQPVQGLIEALTPEEDTPAP